MLGCVALIVYIYIEIQSYTESWGNMPKSAVRRLG